MSREVSIMNTSRVKQMVEHVEGMDESINLDPNAMAIAQSASGSRGILKTLQVEGSIGKLSCKVECTSNHTMTNHSGKIRKIQLLDVNPLSPIIEEMLMLPHSLKPDYIDRTLSNLYYYQMLEEERRECILNLKEDIPDISVSEETEPICIEFYPTREQSITIQWGIVFDPRNYCLKFDIDLSCSEDVVAYYSQNKTVFSYLSGRRQLQSSEDITDFFSTFG